MTHQLRSARPGNPLPTLRRGQLTLEALATLLLLLVFLSILGSALSRTSNEVLRSGQLTTERQALAEQSLSLILILTHPSVQYPPSWLPDVTSEDGRVVFNSSNAQVRIPRSKSSPPVPT